VRSFLCEASMLACPGRPVGALVESSAVGFRVKSKQGPVPNRQVPANPSPSYAKLGAAGRAGSGSSPLPAPAGPAARPETLSPPRIQPWRFDLDRISASFIADAEETRWERAADGFVAEALALGLQLM